MRNLRLTLAYEPATQVVDQANKMRKERGFLARRGGATPVLEATAAIAS